MIILDKLSRKKIFVAHGALIMVALASLGVWAYYLYFYVWTGARQFQSPVEIIAAVCVPPVVALSALAAFKLPLLTRVAFALACAGLVAVLYAVELALDLVTPLVATRAVDTWVDGASEDKKAAIRRIGEQHGIEFDARDAFEVVSELRSRGVDAVPSVHPGALLEPQGTDGPLRSLVRIDGREMLPFGGISNKLTVLCNELGDYAMYHSDEHGFHNPEGLWRMPRIDVAIVGDSFAHGFCVPSEKMFVALIRRRHPLTLNLAMGGHGPLSELASIKEFLTDLKPRVVLWPYFEQSDLFALRDEIRTPLLLRYLRPAFRQGLLSWQREIDTALLAYVEREKSKAMQKKDELKNSERSRYAGKLLQVAKLSTLRSALGLVAVPQDPLKPTTPADHLATVTLYRALLAQAKTTVESWGGALYFVYLPSWERYARPELLEEDRDEILAIVSDLNIPLIDVHKAFESHPDVLSLFPFRRPGHYNIEGNAVLADAILKELP